MENTIVINGVTFHAEKEKNEHPWVIVRSSDAGVFFGELHEQNENWVKLHSSRRLWYWSGAATLSELSVRGVKNPSECKFPEAIEDHKILGVCEILQATEAAKKSIDAVPVWRA